MIPILLAALVQAQAADAPIREVERGAWLQASAGTAVFVGRYRPRRCPVITGARCGLRPAIEVGLAGGYDLVDRPGLSFAVEGRLLQAGLRGPGDGVQEGVDLDERLDGDAWTTTALAGGLVRVHPSRRVGIGVRAEGGVLVSPRLAKAPRIASPALHAQPYPVVAGGPSLEYSTKLAHFAIGVDADVRWIVGLDTAVAAHGWLKYTF